MSLPGTCTTHLTAAALPGDFSLFVWCQSSCLRCTAVAEPRQRASVMQQEWQQGAQQQAPMNLADRWAYGDSSAQPGD